MPAKGSSRNPRYLGLDERGYPMWKGECGHVVLGRSAKMCQTCHNEKRAKPNFIAVVDGRNLYRALECGHVTKRADAKRCRSCTAATALKNHPYSQRYYPVTSGKGGAKRQRIHVMKAEKALGRPLKPGEVVHHINMDKFDHRNCNLLICDRSYHRYIHHAMQVAYARGLVPPP